MEQYKELLIAALERLELINGPEKNCVFTEPHTCPNHSLIRQIRAELGPEIG